jgi:hypothetical protein
MEVEQEGTFLSPAHLISPFWLLFPQQTGLFSSSVSLFVENYQSLSSDPDKFVCILKYCSRLASSSRVQRRACLRSTSTIRRPHRSSQVLLLQYLRLSIVSSVGQKWRGGIRDQLAT